MAKTEVSAETTKPGKPKPGLKPVVDKPTTFAPRTAY